jgi:hypothetical protein
MTTFEAGQDEARQQIQRLIDSTASRAGLEAIRVTFTDRLHRRSDDFDATHGLRLVTAKLQGTSYGTPTVSATS